jgi:tetratricopeptide (TPR) repeat protein
MKKVNILFFALIFSVALFAQDVNVVIKEAQRLETIPDEPSALKKYQEALKLQPTNLLALTRASEICSSIGNRESTNKSRDSYFNAALIYAQTALKVNAESDISNVAMAIAKGRIALTKSGKEKIASVKELKSYAEKAIKINPSNFRAWHVLGKWHYEVSNLTGLERSAAKLFYGALPTASFVSSINCYEKAKVINPTFLLNHLELAKAYKKNDQKDKALAQLRLIATIKNTTADDAKVKIEAAELLKKWE